MRLPYMRRLQSNVRYDWHVYGSCSGVSASWTYKVSFYIRKTLLIHF